MAYAGLTASSSVQHAGLTVERMENWLKGLEFDIAPIVLLAYQHENLMGWLLLFLHDAQRAEINPWALNGHPFVSPEQEKEPVQSQLIKESIAYAKEIGNTDRTFLSAFPRGR